MLWSLGWIFFLLVFYEHFIDNDRSKKISSHFKYAAIGSFFLSLLTVSVFIFGHSLLKFSYSYFLLLFINGIFLLLILIKDPGIVIKLLKAALFFSPLYLLFELSALATGMWIFPGHYIGHVELLGLVFPFEEFFLWIIIGSSVVLAYYEYFIEYKRK